MRHLAFSLGSAGQAFSPLSVRADSFRIRGTDAALLANAPAASARGLPARFGNGQGTALPGPAGSLCELRQSCERWQARPSLQGAHIAEHAARTARSCFHLLRLHWFFSDKDSFCFLPVLVCEMVF